MKNAFHDSKISFWIKKSMSLSMLLFVMLISALESNAVVVPSIYPRFAYVANYGNNTISMYRVDSTTGQFHYNGYVSAGTGPISVTVDPTWRFVYAANSDSNNISVYVIDQTKGTLTAGTAVAAGTSPYSVTVDPTGRFVYVANYNSNNVSVYTKNHTTGALTAGAPVGAGTNPRSITVDPTGEFAYVANTGSDNVSVYSIDQISGALTAGAPVGAGSFPVSVDVDPTGKFAYIANYSSNNVSVYTINHTTGALTAGAPAGAGTNPRSVSVDPTGRFAYVANFGSNNISVYSIDETTGALNAGTAVAAGTGPESITIDPTGNFAYAANDNSGNVYAYSIDQTTGALTRTGIVYSLKNPLSVSITTGVTAQPYVPKFAYATNYNSNDISVYTINQTTGALTAGTAVAAGTGTHFVAVDPTGRFAYVANNLSHSVSVYTINQNTGALTPVETETAGIYTYSVAIDPTGRFLYAPKAGSANIYMYTIDQNTGALTSAGSVATGNWPVFVTIDPSGRFAYIANEGSKDVSVYTINQSTGVLTSVGTTNTGKISYSLTVDPTGRFLYVPNYDTDNVTAYSIHQTTGLLTPLGTVAAGDSPFTVTIDPKGNVAYVINWNSNNVSVYTINQTTGELTSSGTSAAGTAPSAITTAGSFTTFSASLKADYQFQNSLTSSVGSPPPLDTIGGGSNTFVSDIVRGVSTTVLEFPQHNGLSLSSASAIIPGNVYTIAALFSFDSISGYRRIVDFEDGSSDNGLYNYDGKLVFYKSSVIWSAAATMSAGNYSQVVITRDAAKNVIGYVDGVQQFSFADSSDEAVISANDRLKFFRDNTSGSGQNEASPGAVSRIRIYDYVLSAAEVSALEPAAAAAFNLSVSKSGTGAGTVRTPLLCINCGGDCSETYSTGESVTLEAVADAGSVFTGWTGDCSGAVSPATVLMDVDKTCTANFSLNVINGACGSSNGQILASAPASNLCSSGTASPVSGTGPWTWTCGGLNGGSNASCSAPAQAYSITVSKSGTGSGTVTSGIAGINCGSDCSESYAAGTLVELFVTPAVGSGFAGWSGACSGTGQCLISANAAVTAKFEPVYTAPAIITYTLSITKSGSGGGIVISDAEGINCGSDCTGTYTGGRTITLLAKGDSESAFTGWTGCDKAKNTYCSVTMDGNKTPKASFEKNAPVMGLSATALDFERVKTGRLKTKTIKVTNSGNGNLIISSVGIDGDDSSMFSKRIGKSVIKPGQSSTIRVIFKPRSTGQKTAILQIASNDPGHSITEIELTGTAKIK